MEQTEYYKQFIGHVWAWMVSGTVSLIVLGGFFVVFIAYLINRGTASSLWGKLASHDWSQISKDVWPIAVWFVVWLISCANAAHKDIAKVQKEIEASKRDPGGSRVTQSSSGANSPNFNIAKIDSLNVVSKLKPRTISAEARSRMLAELNTSKAMVSIHVDNSDVEAKSLARELKSIIVEAGWDCDLSYDLTGRMMEKITGITLGIRKDIPVDGVIPDPAHPANVLWRALKSADLGPLNSEATAITKSDDLLLVVGKQSEF